MVFFTNSVHQADAIFAAFQHEIGVALTYDDQTRTLVFQFRVRIEGHLGGGHEGRNRFFFATIVGDSLIVDGHLGGFSCTAAAYISYWSSSRHFESRVNA